jgi:hypothetical protein
VQSAGTGGITIRPSLTALDQPYFALEDRNSSPRDRSKESSIRPYIAACAGINVYTGLGPRFLFLNQPLANLALLRSANQVEPAISVGGGMKFLMPKRTQLRVDFQA